MSETIFTQRWVFNHRPVNRKLVLDDSEQATFKYEKANLSTALKDSQILIKTIYLSNDPLQAHWIDASPAEYFGPQLKKGEEIKSLVVGKVVKSTSSGFKPGDFVEGVGGWSEYSVVDSKAFTVFGGNVIDTKTFPVSKIPLVSHVTIFGLSGITATTGIFYRLGLDESNPDHVGKVILVTVAAGGVGSVITQVLSKVFKSKTVYAITGGPQKAEYVESLGPNVIGIDYKDEKFPDNLKTAVAKHGHIDFFFDQAGGFINKAVQPYLNQNATVLHSGGMASQGESIKPQEPNSGLYDGFQLVSKRITVKGHVVSDYAHKYTELKLRLANYIKEGKLTSQATIVDARGSNFIKVPESYHGMYIGKNKGKSLTQINDAE